MLEYRALSPKQDWYFFTTDGVLEEQGLTELSPLTESSSREIWRTYFCANPSCHHPQLLPDSAWARKILASENTEYWQGDWYEQDDAAAIFPEWLCQTIKWPADTKIIFSYSAKYSVEATWEIFRNYWRNFLYEDEGPVLWSLQHSEAIRFMPNGWAYAGFRDAPMIAD
jgi:hypothetical protein